MKYGLLIAVGLAVTGVGLVFLINRNDVGTRIIKVLTPLKTWCLFGLEGYRLIIGWLVVGVGVSSVATGIQYFLGFH